MSGRVRWSQRFCGAAAGLVVVSASAYVLALPTTPPHDFEAGTTISSSEVNANFAELYGWAASVDAVLHVDGDVVALGSQGAPTSLSVSSSQFFALNLVRAGDAGGIALGLEDSAESKWELAAGGDNRLGIGKPDQPFGSTFAIAGASGAVGIGQPEPAHRLDVSGDDYEVLRVKRAEGGGAALRLENSVGESSSIGVSAGSSGGKLVVQSDASEVGDLLTIDRVSGDTALAGQLATSAALVEPAGYALTAHPAEADTLRVAAVDEPGYASLALGPTFARLELAADSEKGLTIGNSLSHGLLRIDAAPEHDSIIRFCESGGDCSWKLNSVSGEFHFRSTSDDPQITVLRLKPESGDVQVHGQVIANGTTLTSTMESKRDISELSPVEYGQLADALEATDVYWYRFKTDSEDRPRRLGVIAELAPAEILATDGRSVSLAEYNGFLLAVTKEQSRRIAVLEERLAVHEAELRRNGVEPVADRSIRSTRQHRPR